MLRLQDYTTLHVIYLLRNNNFFMFGILIFVKFFIPFDWSLFFATFVYSLLLRFSYVRLRTHCFCESTIFLIPYCVILHWAELICQNLLSKYLNFWTPYCTVPSDPYLGLDSTLLLSHPYQYLTYSEQATEFYIRNVFPVIWLSCYLNYYCRT